MDENKYSFRILIGRIPFYESMLGEAEVDAYDVIIFIDNN